MKATTLGLVLFLLSWGATAQATYTWSGEVAQTKSYTFVLALPPGPAIKGEVWYDDARIEKFAAPASEQPREVEVPPLFLTEGPVVLEFRTKTGDLPIATVTLRDALRVHTGPLRDVPTDPLATAEARKLLAFLVSESGKHILSGQQDLTWNDRIDMVARVKTLTGKEPAVLGFDFLNYVGSPSGGGKEQTEEAVAWWKRGGLVAFCWHWRVGSQNEFYTNRTDFRIPAANDGAKWAQLDRDLAVVAAELKRLQDAGVPVLWRPLHEASGGWFWWGASGAEAYKRLWNHVYDQLVRVHGLHNLLWVWNGQHEAWYPGDATVDVVGWDIYGNDKEYYAYPDTWRLAQSIPREAKLVTLSENGPIPDPELLISQKVPWSWFMTWNDGDKNNPADDFFSGPKYMDDAFKKRVYHHPYVLTLDELPSLR